MVRCKIEMGVPARLRPVSLAYTVVVNKAPYIKKETG